MKHISKKVLLFGALSMLASSVPMQAMENAPAEVQKEVAQKQGFFARWTQKAKEMRLKNLMRELDTNWKKFMQCVKGDQGCPRTLVWTIRGILASIIALVTVVTAARVAEKVSPGILWKTPGRPAVREFFKKEVTTPTKRFLRGKQEQLKEIISGEAFEAGEPETEGEYIFQE